MGLIAIARTVRTRGLRGEIVADILTDFPGRFENTVQVNAVGDGSDRQLELESHWFQKHRVILKFKGIDNIEQAEDLLNLDICVPEEEAVELETDEFFEWQLEGCRVVDADGTEVGKVTGVMRTGANENLEVSDGRKQYLIPFVKAICTDVDLENKLIRADIPEGLLDL